MGIIERSDNRVSVTLAIFAPRPETVPAMTSPAPLARKLALLFVLVMPPALAGSKLTGWPLLAVADGVIV